MRSSKILYVTFSLILTFVWRRWYIRHEFYFDSSYVVRMDSLTWDKNNKYARNTDEILGIWQTPGILKELHRHQ